MEDVSFILFLSTFVAGIFTFLAPCTLPLLPAYLGYISGVTREELRDTSNGSARRRVLVQASMFVLGFAAVFILFGTLASVAGSILSPIREVLTVVGGVVVVMFGLFMVGVLNLSFLTPERRVRLPRVLTLGTPSSSLLLGAAFAFGWTPCVGPILGTVLIFAGSVETVFTGTLLLTVFSLGFAIPFLLLALLVSQATRFVERAAPYLHVLSRVGGVVLIILGVTLVVGNTPLTEWFFRLFDHLDLGDVLLRYL